MATGEFGRGKTIFVLAVVIGCFAILWPKIFYPMLTASLNPSAEEGEQCCDVIFVKDTNAHKILNEICANIIRKEIGVLTEAAESRGVKSKAPPKIQIPSTNLCRDDILKTCGVDVVYLIKDNPAISKGYKESLTKLRAFNTSQCMKNNYGVDFQEIGLPRKAKHDSLPSHMRPERPLHFRPDMMHPALREKGRAIHSPLPQRTIEKEARPGPMPGVRPPIGGAGHVPQAPKGGGTMGIIMPIYTIGIVVFFFYTIMKILFRKSDEERPDLPIPAPVPPQIKDFGMDPEHRKFVFAEEYVDKSERSLKDELGKQDRDLGIKRRPPGGKNRSGDERRRLENEPEQTPAQTIETHVTDITKGSSGQSLGEASTLAWLSYELPGDSSSPAFQNEFLLSKSIEPCKETAAKTLESKPTKSLQLPMPSFVPKIKEKIIIPSQSELKSKTQLPDAEILDEFEALSAEILPDDFESIATVFDDIFLKSQEHESLLYPTPTTSLTTTPKALTPEPSSFSDTNKSSPTGDTNSSNAANDNKNIEPDILLPCISTDSESLEKQVQSVIVEESPITPLTMRETTAIPVTIESEHDSSDLEPPAFIPPEPATKTSERISDEVPLSSELESEIDSVLDTIKEAGEILADLVEEQNELMDKSQNGLHPANIILAEQATEKLKVPEIITPEPVSIIVEDLDPNLEGERSALSPGKVEFEEILDVESQIEILDEVPTSEISSTRVSTVILEGLNEETVQDAIIPLTDSKTSELVTTDESVTDGILENVEIQIKRKESCEIKDILDIKETASKMTTEIMSGILESYSNLETPTNESENEKSQPDTEFQPNIAETACKITSEIISSALDSCENVDLSDILSGDGPLKLEPDLLTSPIADDISAHYLTESENSQVVDTTTKDTEAFVDIPTNTLQQSPQSLEESFDELIESLASVAEIPRTFQTPINVESLIAAAQDALNEPTAIMSYEDISDDHSQESESEVGTPTNDLLSPPFLEESSDPVVETFSPVECPVEPPSVESLIAAAQEVLKIPPPIVTFADTVESHKQDETPQEATENATQLQAQESDETSNVDEEGMIELLPTIDETDEKPGETSVEDETTSKSVDLTSSSISQITVISVESLSPSQETKELVSEPSSSPKPPVELTAAAVEPIGEIPTSAGPQPTIPSDDTEKQIQSTSEEQESVVSVPPESTTLDNSEKITEEPIPVAELVSEPTVTTDTQTSVISGEQEKAVQISEVTEQAQTIEKAAEIPEVTGETSQIEKSEEIPETTKTAEILEKAVEISPILETTEIIDKTNEAAPQITQTSEILEKAIETPGPSEAIVSTEKAVEIPERIEETLQVEKSEEIPEAIQTAEIVEKAIEAPAPSEVIVSTEKAVEIPNLAGETPQVEKSEEIPEAIQTAEIVEQAIKTPEPSEAIVSTEKAVEIPDLAGETPQVEKSEETSETIQTAEIIEKAVETPEPSEAIVSTEKAVEIPDLTGETPQVEKSEETSETIQTAEIIEKAVATPEPSEAIVSTEKAVEIPDLTGETPQVEKSEETSETTQTAEIIEKAIETPESTEAIVNIEKAVETPVSIEKADETSEILKSAVASEEIETVKTTDSVEKPDEKLEVTKTTANSELVVEKSEESQPECLDKSSEIAQIEKLEDAPEAVSIVVASEKSNETSETPKITEILEKTPEITEIIKEADKSTDSLDGIAEVTKVVESTDKLDEAPELQIAKESTETIVATQEGPGTTDKSIETPKVSETGPEVVEQSKDQVTEGQEPSQVETITLEPVGDNQTVVDSVVERKVEEKSEDIIEPESSVKTETSLQASGSSDPSPQSTTQLIETERAEKIEIPKESERIGEPEPVSSEPTEIKMEDSPTVTESQTAMPSVVELSLSASLEVSVAPPEILSEPSKVVEIVESDETVTATVAEPVDNKSAERTAGEESGMQVEANVTANIMALTTDESESPALDSVAQGIYISAPPVLETDSAKEISPPPSSVDGKSGETQRSQAVDSTTTDSSGSAKAQDSNEQGAQDANESGHRDRDARDIEIDMLRKRLEETEAAMERIVAQMGSVSDRISPTILAQVLKAQGVLKEELGSSSVPKSKASSQSAEKESPEKVQAQEGKSKKRVQIELPKKDLTSEEEEEEEEDSSSFARPPTPPRTVSIKPKQQQTRTSESQWQSKDNNSMINFAQDLSASIVNQSAAAAIAKAKAAANAPAGEKVSVVGFEESFSMESGKKWNERSPTPTNRVSSPLPRAPTPPEDIPSIFLAGPMPASANQILVSDPQIEIEGEEGDYDDDDYDSISAPVVLSGKVTLSVISGDDITEAPSVSLDDHGRADRDPNSRGHSSVTGDGKSKKVASNVQKSSKASSPDMDEYEVVAKGGFNDADLEDDADLTYYSTATDAEADIGGNETAGDISQMEGLEDTSKDDILDDEEEEEEEEDEEEE